MKTKIRIGGFLTMIICGCTSPQYLPSPEDIDINQYGSYIRILQNNADKINGELIAADTNNIIVLTESKSDGTKKCVIVPVNEVSSFKLQYAESKHYGWTIPLSLIITISHGYNSIFTAPVNLLFTIPVTLSGENAFTYTGKQMNYYMLYTFARFPQGIPPNVDITSLK